LIDCQTDYSPNNPKVFITNMKTLTTSTNPTAEDDRRLGRLRLQGLRLPLGLRPLLVGRRLGHNINNWLFRTVNIEKTLVTQNSGVLNKGEAKGTNWYGVIKRMISLEFSGQKEVILFQYDWFDVPLDTSTNRGKGYSKDKFWVIDIDTTRHRFRNEPYILATQAELVFYVNLVNKLGWSSVISMKPRDLFAMPELDLEDSLAVGIEGIHLLGEHQDLTNWSRSDKEGTPVMSQLLIRFGPRQLMNQTMTYLMLMMNMMQTTRTLMMELLHQ
jgi:hypothetical protein